MKFFVQYGILKVQIPASQHPWWTRFTRMGVLVNVPPGTATYGLFHVFPWELFVRLFGVSPMQIWWKLTRQI